MKTTDICFLINDMGGGGAERVVLNLSESFARKGLNVDLVVAHSEGRLQGLISDKVNVVDLKTGRMEKALLAYIRYLREHKPAKVVVSLEAATLVAILGNIMSSHKPDLYIRVDNTLYRDFAESKAKWFKYVIWRKFMRLAFHKAKAVIPVSDGVAEEICEIAPKANTVCIYNPVLKDPIIKVDTSKRGGKIAQFLAMGRLEDQKNYPMMLRAFARVRSMFDCKLLILGEGSKRDNLEKMIRELKIENSVEMPGFQKDPFRFFGPADIYLMSSNHEGLPTVLIEALAARVPVISTDCKHGPDQVLQGGKYGKLVAVGDEDAFVSAMSDMLENPFMLDEQSLQKHLLQFTEADVQRKYEILMGM